MRPEGAWSAPAPVAAANEDRRTPLEGIPLATHVVAGVALPALMVGWISFSFGIDTSGSWLPGGSPDMGFVVLRVLAIVLPIPTFMEAWAISYRPTSWTARIAAVFNTAVGRALPFHKPTCHQPVSRVQPRPGERVRPP